MSNELLPCPFCGCSGKHKPAMCNTVYCTNDELCPIKGYGIPLEKWNTRPTNDLQERNRELIERIRKADKELFNFLKTYFTGTHTVQCVKDKLHKIRQLLTTPQDQKE